MSILNKRELIKNMYECFRRNTKIRCKHTSDLPLFATVKKFAEKTALYDYKGNYTFANIFVGAQELSKKISNQLQGKTNERVIFLCSNDASYVVTLWAIWMSGQIAVPLSPLHPENILQYYVEDTRSKLLVATPPHRKIMTKISKKTNTNLYLIEEKLQKQSGQSINLDGVLPFEFYEKNNALILYTSGTTGNPKGVVLSHNNLLVQTKTLIESWKWSSNDVILHTLPLHHVHGTVNALFCPLYVGATTIMLPKFSAEATWSHLLGTDKRVTVFMAVPTIYSKLVEEYDRNMKSKNIKTHLQSMKLMVSGSAPLPVPLYEKWLEITGHKLLERYGMTEIGMCLSNEYDSDRVPGYVGVPLPRVSVRLSENTEDTYTTLLECRNENGVTFDRTLAKDVSGELLVKGASVFKEYFNKPEATRKEFTEDGWFKTGDMCEYSLNKKMFRMLGRTSVDIIKSGGYKISALQIETKLLAHPDIKECAVVGISDDVWGEKVAAVVVLANGSSITLDELRKWAADKMPKYSLPTVLKVVREIPKNSMGKVNKKELVQTVFK